MTDRLRTNLAAGLSLRAVSRAALGCLLGAVLLSTGTPARAGDDDNSGGVPIDTRIMRGIMESLGLRRDGAGIDYQERAPLVIPPSKDLPPPERSDAALAKNPAWPKDPDVLRAREEARQARSVSMNADENLQNNPLRPDQMTPGPKPRSKRIGDDGYRASPNGSGGPLSPSQLDTKPGLFSKIFGKDQPDTGSFTGEPPRTALTEPPLGYQTPSPEQPYGVSKRLPPAKTSSDYLIDHPVGSQ